jgi:putative transposase
VKKSRFSESQIVGALKEHEAGTPTKDLSRRHGISPAMFYAWKAKFGGMEVNDVAKMRALEDEKWPFETDRRRSGASHRYPQDCRLGKLLTRVC